MNTTLSRRMLTPTLTTWMTAATVLGAAWVLPTTAMAAAATSKVGCRVHAVLASKEGSGELPKELEFLRATLADDQFAAYKSFHLVDKKTLTLDGSKPADTSFGSGHRIALTLLGSDATRLKLHLKLSERDGTSSRYDTDYSIEDNGLLMLEAGPFKHAAVSGKLFFAIQCARAG